MRSLRHLLSSPLLALPFLFSTTAPVARGPEDPAGENLSEALEAVRAKAGVPGLLSMAVQDGEITAWAAAGVRKAGAPELMSIHDPIHLGSCSKAMTSTLAATLIEAGVMTWETTIAQALPEFSKTIDEGFHTVTIEELLQHRGGIAERRRPEIAALHETLATLEGTPVATRLEILALVLAPPPLPPAPNTFDYSNFGYMTAGAMMEELTGKSWEALILERLFEPLGMRSAGVGSPFGEGVPVGHLRENGSWTPLKPGPEGQLHKAMSPAGLLHTNLEDWAKFMGEHMAGAREEDGLLSAETYQRLQENPGSGYAAGWGIAKHTWSWGSGKVLTHNGSDGTWHSLVYALPEWDLVIMSASNASESAGDQATREAKNLMLESLGFLD